MRGKVKKDGAGVAFTTIQLLWIVIQILSSDYYVTKYNLMIDEQYHALIKELRRQPDQGQY